jgi:hypothetical protein
MLIEARNGWRLLTVPSAFEIGLGDCRWIYKLGGQTVTISVIVASDEPAVQWRAIIEGEPCRFVIFGQLVLGEHEFAHAGRMEIYKPHKKFTFRPDPDSNWARKYPEATYHLVTSTPDQFEVIGADELLYVDGERRSGAFVAIRTFPTNGFAFAVVGSMTDPKQAEALSAKYSEPLDDGTMVVQSNHFWDKVKRGIRIESTGGDEEAARAMDTIFPWLVHDGMVHLKVPHGLEQYSTAAWGTRDVCQGPIELLLSLQHDEPAKDILRIVFAQQYEKRGDWPQWFMLEPYSAIQDRDAHGDVIVWPLKALCDYIEATGDFDFLNELVPWRRDENFEKTANAVRSQIMSKADGDRAATLHRWHTSDPLWKRGLERLSSAGRPHETRLDGEQLDSRASLPAALALRRDPAQVRPGGQSSRARPACHGHARGLQSLSRSRPYRGGLWRLQP